MLNLRGVYFTDSSSGASTAAGDIAFNVLSPRNSFIVGNLGATLSTFRVPCEDGGIRRSHTMVHEGASPLGSEATQISCRGSEDEWDISEEPTFTALHPFQASIAMGDFRLARVPGYAAAPHTQLMSEVGKFTGPW